MFINPHFGPTLDSFLEEEGLLERAQAVAIKRVIALELQDVLKRENITQTELARRMGTSKAAVSRLLNPDNPSITLYTILKAAYALGKKVSLSID